MAVDAPPWTPSYNAGSPNLPTSILRGSRVGHGSTIINGQMNNLGFTSGSSGWAILADGTVEFNNGNFRGDITGATGTFSGGLSIGSGFKVDTSGNVWWGAAGSYAAATNKISSSGQITFTTGSINIGSGAFVVTTGGAVTMTSATVTGGLTATGGSSLPATYFASGTIPAGVTVGMADAASVSIRSGDFSTGSAGWAIFGDGSCEFNNITARGVLSTAVSGTRIAVGSGAVNYIDFHWTTTKRGEIFGDSATFVMRLADGGASISMDDDTSNLTISASNILQLGTTTGAIKVIGDGGVQIYTDANNADVELFSGLNISTYSAAVTGIQIDDSADNINMKAGADITFDAASDVIIDGAATIQFKQAGTEYGRIDNSAGEGYIELFSTGSLNGGRIYLRAGSGATSSDDVLLRHITGAGTDWLEIRGTTAGQIAIIDIGTALYSRNSTGGRALEVSSGNVIYSNTSSARIKEDIQPIDAAEMWEKVRRMELVTFKPKPEFDGSGHGHYEFGGTAEQIASVEDRLVSFTIEEDESLTPFGLRYDRFGVIALALVRDLKGQVEDLAALADSQAARIRALEAA